MYAEAVRKFEYVHFDATDVWFHLRTGADFQRPIPQLLQLIKVSDNSIETIGTNGPSGMTKQFYGGVLSPSTNSPSSLLPLELFSAWTEWSLASRLGDVVTSFVSS